MVNTIVAGFKRELSKILFLNLIIIFSFFCLAGDTDIELGRSDGLYRAIPSPPRDLSSRSASLSHCKADRGTSGQWTITV